MPEDFKSVLEKLSDLPAMPLVAVKVLRVLQDPDADAEDLAEIIVHDAMMTAQVLKMANSSYYSLSNRVKTVEHAIVVLGEKAMRNVVFAASLKGLGSRFGLIEKMLWDDSIGCAIAARVIAQRFGGVDPEEAFLGGLLRHFGRVVMNLWDSEAYSRVMEGVYNGEGSLEEMERRHFPTSHAMIGATVLRQWNFSDCLVRLVLNHEDFTLSEDEDPVFRRMAAAVNLADHFCRRLGIGHRDPDPGHDIERTPGAHALQVEGAELQEALAEFEEVFARDREAFSG